MTQNNYEQSLTESVDAYLDTVHHVKTDVQGNINDNVRVVIKSEYDYTLREIICNLLAGRGLKVPNLQICLNANLKALLGDPRIAEELKEALQSLSDAFDEFMEHTNIENVLNRINNALAEVTQVANMINFCATPVKPKAIPNVLENIMNSYLGAGKELCDKLGRLIPDQVSACLLFSSDGTSQFNTNLFEGGLLGQIADDWDRIISGELTQNEINAFLATIDDIKEDFQKLVRFDNDVAGSYDLGGSSFGQIDININKGLGVLHNPASAGIQGNTRIAAQLKTTFDRLAGYPVVDADGNVHDNIFDLILEPDMLELLRKIPDPTPDIGASQPVYDYCGNIIGYTTSFSQEEKKKSAGDVPTPPTNSPGFNAGGIPTSNDGNSGTTGSSNQITIVNSTASGEPKFTGSIITSSDSPEEVLFDGTRMSPDTNSSWFVIFTAIGRSSSGLVTTIKQEGIVDNTGGVVSAAIDPSNKTTYRNNSTTVWDATLDDSTGELRVLVSGDAIELVSWSIKLEFLSVSS